MSFRNVQNAAAVLSGGRRRWWQKWWGKLFLVVVGLILAYGAVLGVTTYRLYRQIQIGTLPTQGFTTANISATTPVPALGAALVTPASPRFGAENARVTIVEFGDFQCPFCQQAFSIFRQMMARYGKQVLFVWRDFPVSDIHAQAQGAAEAARCAHEQGKFWEYHDMLFLNQGDLTAGALQSYAGRVGLDTKAFGECVASHRYAKAVQDDFAAGVANKVRGTPTFFLNGFQVAGVIPADLFSAAIEKLLK